MIRYFFTAGAEDTFCKKAQHPSVEACNSELESGLGRRSSPRKHKRNWGIGMLMLKETRIPQTLKP